MRRTIWLFLLLAFTSVASTASADGGGPFRRTTPRGSLDQEPDGLGGLMVGIPGGRAWGVEGALLPLGPPGVARRVTVDLAVDDPDVSEAFVRIAYYARADLRSRQLATIDSPYVRAGVGRQITLELDPPPGAVAFRLRVLGRLVAGAAISRGDAIRARWSGGPAEQGLRRPSLTRLLEDLW